MSNLVTLQGLRSSYDYVKEKDLTNGEGFEIDFNREQKRVNYSLMNTSVEFASKVMVRQMQDYLKYPVHVQPTRIKGVPGVNFILDIPDNHLLQTVTVDSSLHDLRGVLKQDYGYQLGEKLARYLVDENEKTKKE